MSRHSSRHNGISCDACGKSGFGGKRYKCLACYDFDLCQDCFDGEETGQGQHSTDHPMQVILTKVEADVFFGGENHSIDQPQSFTCPLCGELGFSDSELRDHVTRLHTDTANLPEVICPVCAAYPNGNPNHQTSDFPGHLMLDHSRSLRDADLFHDQGSMHSRVRRMMVRRRGGGERHYGLFRESQLSQDNSVDPLSELLSHLGGTGRRIPSDIPPHIQQLLDHQERQAFERSSPSRRPVYRKLLIAGSGGRPRGGGTHSLFSPSPREVLELSRGVKETQKMDSSILNQTQKDSSAYLLNNYKDTKLSEQEQELVERQRCDRSLFVQDLLLSSLAFSDSSSDSNEET